MLNRVHRDGGYLNGEFYFDDNNQTIGIASWANSSTFGGKNINRLNNRLSIDQVDEGLLRDCTDIVKRTIAGSKIN